MSSKPFSAASPQAAENHGAARAGAEVSHTAPEGCGTLLTALPQRCQVIATAPVPALAVL